MTLPHRDELLRIVRDVRRALAMEGRAAQPGRPGRRCRGDPAGGGLRPRAVPVQPGGGRGRASRRRTWCSPAWAGCSSCVRSPATSRISRSRSTSRNTNRRSTTCSSARLTPAAPSRAARSPANRPPCSRDWSRRLSNDAETSISAGTSSARACAAPRRPSAVVAASRRRSSLRRPGVPAAGRAGGARARERCRGRQPVPHRRRAGQRDRGSLGIGCLGRRAWAVFPLRRRDLFARTSPEAPFET